jgi:hypothetical protein
MQRVFCLVRVQVQCDLTSRQIIPRIPAHTWDASAKCMQHRLGIAAPVTFCWCWYFDAHKNNNPFLEENVYEKWIIQILYSLTS